MKKWKELSEMTKRLSIIAGVVIVLGGGFGGYKVYAQQQHNQAKEAIETSLKAVGDQGALTKKIASLMDDKGYLAKDLDAKTIDSTKTQLHTLKDAVTDYEKKYSNEELPNESELSKLEKRDFCCGNQTSDSAGSKQTVPTRNASA
ncbi:hypothetical protein [Enterococcus gallinarum]|uniref:hypothetical protein n=1 Tax=Enterococcus gallinarum TaxID=1353 RepID=UPI0018AC0ACC|nr:hypothetical protein [Enterococcus gallinarum]